MTPKKVNQKYFVQEREEEDREGTHQEYEKASREMKGGWYIGVCPARRNSKERDRSI